MFTGIVESMAEVCAIRNEGTNVRFTLKCAFTSELKIDQSLAHNGVCLTVVNINENKYDVVAIHETLIRTNLGVLKVGDKVNLERCMQMNGRLDGHIVQGHVDTTARVERIISENGSWRIYFSYVPSPEYITVEKGSVCINGVSLTVVDSGKNDFSVAIIPYTWENTNFHSLKPGDDVNIEFDIIGKYVGKFLSLTHN
ncbi:MAG: riboflavin synthase [Bacteroidota bacterium]